MIDVDVTCRGTFACDNPKCDYLLNVDHVTLITTAHVRRFCSVFCVVEGHEATMEAWAKEQA